eukprot:6149133-Lingulodinium_polyedra.AAC.1
MSPPQALGHVTAQTQEGMFQPRSIARGHAATTAHRTGPPGGATKSASGPPGGPLRLSLIHI